MRYLKEKMFFKVHIIHFCGNNFSKTDTTWGVLLKPEVIANSTLLFWGWRSELDGINHADSGITNTSLKMLKAKLVFKTRQIMNSELLIPHFKKLVLTCP